MNKRILALDLGTYTGWAYQAADGTVTGGTLELVIGKEERRERLDRRADPRVLQFFEWLRTRVGLVDIVVFEDVQFSSYTLQVQLWSSLRAAVWLAFGGRPGVFIDAVPVGSLKKFATGSGAADKEAMASALIRFKRGQFCWPRVRTGKKVILYDTISDSYLDDNGIDARLLLIWATTFIKI